MQLENTFKQPFDEDKNFHFYPAGPIPPNPQELLSDSKINELKGYLQKNYDVIIIDTPPYGIVADAQILGQIVDTTFNCNSFWLHYERPNYRDRKVECKQNVSINGCDIKWCKTQGLLWK